MNRKEEEMKEDFILKEQEFEAACREILARADEEKKKTKKLITNQIAERKKILLQKVKFDPKLFSKAVPVAYNCEHLKTKAWGNNYAKGVRCCVCGKELSELHNEDSQVLGYGSGCDPALYEAVVRHRDNEQSFRFKSTEELQLVEQERVRLEKERREMDENEMYFYDFQDLKVIYDFDHRHARDIKSHGIFRQGLQWTEMELENYEEAKVIRERERLAKEGLPESLLEEFDPLSTVQEPPPTFRAADERRLAQYRELQFAIGRLHNFQKRINEYKMIRFELLAEREMYSHVLDSLHKDSYVYESQLHSLEFDLDRTSKLLDTFANMQLLWQQANHIQNQAKKDKMKAEMNRVGVWDDVRECLDKTSILKDETMALLRVKYLMDQKLANQEKSVDYRQQYVDTCYTKYVEAEKLCKDLQYIRPGNLVYTRYGQCYITSYRPIDDIVMVTLPFGNPPAKAWIHYKEIVDLERSKQRSENILMEEEDYQMHKIVNEERIRLKKERYAMQRAEEGLRRYYEFIDLGKNEKSVVQKTISDTVEERFLITESKKYNQLQEKTIKQLLKKAIDERKARRKGYIGPPSGRPKAMSMWEAYKERKKITAELKEHFILAGANEADRKAHHELEKVRFDWVQNYMFTNFIDTVISEIIVEVADEAFNEGRVAKGFAERKSGIIFPNPPWMQYGTYNELSTIWVARKNELKAKIEMNKGIADKIISQTTKKTKQKPVLDPILVAKMKAEKQLRKLEKERQEKLCAEMAAEELRCREFYRKELLENLRERRMMKEEERLSKQMKEEYDRARMEAESIYSVIGHGGGDGSGGGKGGVKKDLTYERRRQELKELTLERRRRTEEQAHMTIEDQLSHALRELDLLERQKKKYIEEFGADEDDDSDTESVYEEINGVMVKSSKKRKKGEDGGRKKEMKIPDWLMVPKEYANWDILTRNKYIQMQTTIRNKKKKIEKNIQREYKRLERLENKSFQEWQNIYKVAEQSFMESEVSMMEAEEDLRDAESKLIDLKENLMRILIFCREKGEEELKSRSELKHAQEIARRRDKELHDAEKWLNLCIKRSKNRDKLKRRVSTDCKWVDTDTINGFHQRFATELLRERLYMYYFKEIVASIINRAEIIATERKLFGLQEQLSFNKAKLVDRTRGMKSLLADIRREERMRMHRSLLNEKFFPLNRKQVLSQRFGSWVRFFYWNRGHQDAYTLKYELIKRQLDIDRQFKEQLKKKTMKEIEEDENKFKYQIVTLMQRHKERTVQCKNCTKFYLESQNTSSSCEYHPKQYVMECPSSCPNPGLTVLCMAHRKRRWTCCDSVRMDCIGCSRRNHIPLDSDPVYDKIMEKINKRDEEFLSTLDQKVDEARKQDWESKALKAKKAQIWEIEDTITAARATADRIKDLKFI